MTARDSVMPVADRPHAPRPDLSCEIEVVPAFYDRDRADVEAVLGGKVRVPTLVDFGYIAFFAVVLTLFEHIPRADLPFYVGLMDHLARHDVRCPAPVR